VAKSTRPRYSWVWLAITNIVAYYTVVFTVIKSLKVQGPGAAENTYCSLLPKNIEISQKVDEVYNSN
jgi:hypothetical protein